VIRGGTAGAIVRLGAPTRAGPPPRAAAAATRGPLRAAGTGAGTSKLNSRRRRFLNDLRWAERRHDRLLEALRELAGLDASRSDAALRLGRFLGTLVFFGGLPPAAAQAEWGDRDAVDWDTFADPAHALTGWVLATSPSDVEALAVACSLPPAYARRLVADHRGGVGAGRVLDGDREALDLLGDLAEPVLLARALKARAPLTLRANRLRGDRPEASAALADEGIPTRPSRWTDAGLLVEDGHPDVQATRALRDGLVEVQDEGSALLVELLDPRPGETVVDACAGAGGKTLAIGARLAGEGELIALDVRRPALAELERRAARAGIAVRALPVRPHGPLPKRVEALRGRVDRLLLDVPCSGSGALRRRVQYVDDRRVAALAALQARLLERHAPLVRPGGLLVYATCSLFADENDAVVRAFLASPAGAGFEPVPVAELLGPARAEALGADAVLRLLPHRHGTDGFFGAALRRAGNAPRSPGVEQTT